MDAGIFVLHTYFSRIFPQQSIDIKHQIWLFLLQEGRNALPQKSGHHTPIRFGFTKGTTSELTGCRQSPR